MKSQTATKATEPKGRTRTATKAARLRQKKSDDATTGNNDANATKDTSDTINTTSSNGSKRKKRKTLKEMTLEELSLRAYKMTYERLHGSKSKKK